MELQKKINDNLKNKKEVIELYVRPKHTNSINVEQFSWTHKGILVMEAANYYADGDLIQLLRDSILSYEDLGNKITGKSLYRYPKLSLPREKLNVVNEKYDSKVIRDYDSADYLIVSEKYFTSSVDNSWNSVGFNSSHELLIKLEKGKEFFDPDYYNEVVDFVSQDVNRVYIINSGYYYGNNSNQYSDHENRVADWLKSFNDLKSGDGYTHFIKPAEEKRYMYLCKNMHRVILDNDLTSLATEDSVPLDRNSYIQITKMLKSDDEDNRAVALEIMANCQTDESHTYLALLFAFQHEYMRYHKNWNHVNFKALRQKFDEYIRSSEWTRGYSYDYLVKTLSRNNALTEYAMRIIAKSMFEQVLSSTFGITGNSVFEIDESVLTLREEWLSKVNGARVFEVVEEDLPF
ncbi:MAG: hypothetical protein CMH79_05320 [Nitrospinae bacterium]|nr:hypothetical protein [Nitrospinota bacterium]